MFESCVVLDGDKTQQIGVFVSELFESCVVLDGDKTAWFRRARAGSFESCVVLDGDKTDLQTLLVGLGLRVVLF